MTRRDFMAAMAAAGTAGSLPARIQAATPFPLHYARSSPFDTLVHYVEPGTDEFQGEKAAIELEARLARDFSRTEPAATARFYGLPDSLVRFEISKPTRYQTGIWQLPDFKVLQEDTVVSPKPYFRDVTAHVFGGSSTFQKQLLHGCAIPA